MFFYIFLLSVKQAKDIYVFFNKSIKGSWTTEPGLVSEGSTIANIYYFCLVGIPHFDYPSFTVKPVFLFNKIWFYCLTLICNCTKVKIVISV
jgi:hypothetical protein